MDQFRGYTVAGMFLVNFLGGLAAVHSVLKHHNPYFSYADTIMPSFMFACGFSYRLSLLRRLAQAGPGAYGRVVERSLGLVLVSLVVFGVGGGFDSWAEMTGEAPQLVVGLIKADLWEVLAIIGICQIFLLPVVARSARVRFLAMASPVGWSMSSSLDKFNYDFVSRPAELDGRAAGAPAGVGPGTAASSASCTGRCRCSRAPWPIDVVVSPAVAGRAGAAAAGLGDPGDGDRPTASPA